MWERWKGRLCLRGQQHNLLGQRLGRVVGVDSLITSKLRSFNYPTEVLRPADKISEHDGNISCENSLLAGGGKALRSKTRTPVKKASVGKLLAQKTLPSLEQAEEIRGQTLNNEEQDVKQMSETQDESLKE